MKKMFIHFETADRRDLYVQPEHVASIISMGEGKSKIRTVDGEDFMLPMSAHDVYGRLMARWSED